LPPINIDKRNSPLKEEKKSGSKALGDYINNNNNNNININSNPNLNFFN
jgi:hypothetical protein